MQVAAIEYWGTTIYESKYVFSYTGEEIKEDIHSYKQTGGAWTESSKNVYSYSSGKISKITEYYKNDITWTSSGYEDFSYDTHGNLIKQISYYNNSTSTDKTEYAYEEGNGNFRLINDALGGYYNNLYPTPNKKSKNLKVNFNKTTKFHPWILYSRGYLDF
jgi:hypothetical protein